MLNQGQSMKHVSLAVDKLINDTCCVLLLALKQNCLLG